MNELLQINQNFEQTRGLIAPNAKRSYKNTRLRKKEEGTS